MTRSAAGHRGAIASRATGALALVAWLGTVAWLVLLVAMHVGVIALVALVIFPTGVVGGWYFLSSRGLKRWLGVAVLVLGVVLAVVAFVRAHIIDDLALLFALALVSVTCARLALGRQSTWRAVRTVAPASRPAAFLNARSGGGKVVKFGLVEAAAARGAEVVMIEPGLDLRAAAEEAVRNGADVLVAAGGDGTQAIIADVAH